MFYNNESYIFFNDKKKIYLIIHSNDHLILIDENQNYEESRKEFFYVADEIYLFIDLYNFFENLLNKVAK